MCFPLFPPTTAPDPGRCVPQTPQKRDAQLPHSDLCPLPAPGPPPRQPRAHGRLSPAVTEASLSALRAHQGSQLSALLSPARAEARRGLPAPGHGDLLWGLCLGPWERS